jgi:hypothetical protein
MEPPHCMLWDIVIPEASSCKYLGIIVRSDLRWADQVIYMVKKAWKALHFTMCILKKCNSNTKCSAYTSLVWPILECGVACWDHYRKGQINVLDWVQNTAATFAHHRSDSSGKPWQLRKIAHICAVFKVYMGEWAWRAVGDRVRRPFYLNRVDHNRKMKSREQKTYRKIEPFLCK